MIRQPLCILDFETTGYRHEPHARAIELGAVWIDADGRELAAFASLIRPDVLDERAAEALAVNGIDPALLALAPSPDVVRVAFETWHWMTGWAPVTSWNRLFDEHFAVSMGLRLPWTDCAQLAARPVMGDAAALRPDADGSGHLIGPRLTRAAEFFGVVPTGAHRALADARTAAAVIAALWRRA